MSSSTDDRVVVGRVVKPHGVRGEVSIAVLSDAPGRFAAGSSFDTGDEPPRCLVIESLRRHHQRLLVRFEGVADRPGAEALRGTLLTIPMADRRELDSGEYWPESLAGLDAQTTAGQTLGTVTAVVTNETQDRLVVETPEGARVEVPFVAAIVVEIDLAAGTAVIDPPEGLF